MRKIDKPYIVYSLPNSKVDQRLKNSNLDTCWIDVEDFISSITDKTINEPIEIKLVIFNFKNSIEPEKSFSYYNEELMNNSKFQFIIENSRKGIREGEWILNTDILNPTKDFFSKNQKKIKSNSDISLIIHFNFYLIDPEKRSKLDDQQFLSSFTLYISRDVRCSPTIYFPFEENNRDFWEYFDKVKSRFPFEVDEKNLKIPRLKDGKITSFKKVIRLEE